MWAQDEGGHGIEEVDGGAAVVRPVSLGAEAASAKRQAMISHRLNQVMSQELRKLLGCFVSS